MQVGLSLEDGVGVDGDGGPAVEGDGVGVGGGHCFVLFGKGVKGVGGVSDDDAKLA